MWWLSIGGNMGDIRNEYEGDKLAYSLLSSCGKCPECGHYLTIKADYKRAAKNFVAKKVCINRHFGCNYEEDISEDFNNALGLKNVLKKDKKDSTYDLEMNFLKNRVNAYATTGTLKQSKIRDIPGKKNSFVLEMRDAHGKKISSIFSSLDPIVFDIMKKRMGDIRKCESCNEEFHFYSHKRNNFTTVYELVCPCCDATADISDFIGYNSFLERKIDRADLSNFFNVTSINDCKIKWK